VGEEKKPGYSLKTVFVSSRNGPAQTVKNKGEGEMFKNTGGNTPEPKKNGTNRGKQGRILSILCYDRVQADCLEANKKIHRSNRDGSKQGSTELTLRRKVSRRPKKREDLLARGRAANHRRFNEEGGGSEGKRGYAGALFT